MTLTTHAVIGAAIGSLVGNPAIGFSIGLVSHLLVDMIPHGDNNLADKYRKEKKARLGIAYVTVDAVIAIILLMSVVSGRPTDTTTNIAFSAAVMGSILPDLLIGLKEIFPKNKPLRTIFKIHFFFHDCISRRYGDTKLSYAIAGQTAFVLALMYYIIP
ncbi:hypothetical protein EBT31_08455 [bacterium]|nr:hypothetical protein [bacterium]NBX49431.1 hypothetical protein [bacterium]